MIQGSYLLCTEESSIAQIGALQSGWIFFQQQHLQGAHDECGFVKLRTVQTWVIIIEHMLHLTFACFVEALQLRDQLFRRFSDSAVVEDGRVQREGDPAFDASQLFGDGALEADTFAVSE